MTRILPENGPYSFWIHWSKENIEFEQDQLESFRKWRRLWKGRSGEWKSLVSKLEEVIDECEKKIELEKEKLEHYQQQHFLWLRKRITNE